ncbi:phage putative head morphogenesis protein, SPP1 gp7 family [Arthrobacter sp. FB24]|uniref:phage minor head protein n=1 Tax=Arthrobacter sp. (strain FB24) TaxID=290399 RepID=UPI000052695E|nr:phage minor head protein [Arthrobacter sp. FB24]ABK02758.1 phage putative head morphogenesis protein, SPP1 gp7 family [Arthrobacter sp. FB24]
MAITPETLRIVDRLRAQLTVMTDAQTVALTRAWVEAWDALVPDFEVALIELMAGASGGVLSRGQVAKSIRLRDALQASRGMLDQLATVAEVTVAGDVAQAVLDAVDGHAALVTSQLPPNAASVGVSFTRMSPDALAAIVERTTAQIHSATLPLAADTERVMKRALIRGIAVGDNPRRTASRIMAQTEQRFNGGLTRALVISRTETLDAHRAATQASEKTNTKILEEWEWHAALDARTCPSCLAQHGTRHSLTESGPNDHHQGRCARVSVTKSWAELGFTGIEEPASLTPGSQDWFNNLTADSQLAIMGPGRLELLNAGKISWADLSTVKQTDGWRDSHTATTLKDLLRKAA